MYRCYELFVDVVSVGVKLRQVDSVPPVCGGAPVGVVVGIVVANFVFESCRAAYNVVVRGVGLDFCDRNAPSTLAQD